MQVQRYALINFAIAATFLSFLGCKRSEKQQVSGTSFFGNNRDVQTDKAAYINPLIAKEQVTSGWCVRRNVGTCPHIGLDWVWESPIADQDNVVVAPSNGYITQIWARPSCGWFVFFRGSHGEVYRFLHLDYPKFIDSETMQPTPWDPTIREGTTDISKTYDPPLRVLKGQRIASLGSYPSSGCGTGPHLHFERIEAGSFGGDFRSDTCPGEPTRDCHFNPETPFVNKPILSTHREAFDIYKQGIDSGEGPPTPPENETPCSNVFTESIEMSDPLVESSDGLRIILDLKKQNWAQDFWDSLTQLRWGRSFLDIKMWLRYPNRVQPSRMEENVENICDEENDRRCIMQYEIFVRDKRRVNRNRWWRIGESRNAGDQPIELNKVCLVPNAGNDLRVMAITNEGNRVNLTQEDAFP